MGTNKHVVVALVAMAKVVMLIVNDEYAALVGWSVCGGTSIRKSVSRDQYAAAVSQRCLLHTKRRLAEKVSLFSIENPVI
jgi:hypothetical protein